MPCGGRHDSRRGTDRCDREHFASALLDRQNDHRHNRCRTATRRALRRRCHVRRLGRSRSLQRWRSRALAAARRSLEEHGMFTWGLIVFVGLWLILADVGAVRKAKLMGNPILMHIIVIGSGLLIHGGSADGAMAAIVSGCFSALYVRWQQRMHGYIRKGVWYPGVLRATDPRLAGAA